ncbi:hypothetical protein C8R43DRAFT_340046 [Mycena crocata]|nr:hypothetical protein C8R43DRAFT_340046 [Mycena crocata]
MPELRREVLEAFALLNLSSDCGASEAAKAYKTEALRHHPDKNLGDPGAIQRFQEVGAAWDTLQRHYEDPSSSYVRNFPQASDDDDGFSPDLSFFMFMFEEMLFERYSRGSRREYRSRRGGGGPAFSFGIGRQGPIFFTAQPSSYYSSSGRSSGGYSQLRESENDNVQNQTRQKAAYEKRLKEFEQEIEAEKRDLAKRAAEKSKDENRRVAAYQQAFLAARTGKTSTVISLVNEYHLDVNSPEKIPKTTGKKATTNFQTLLHAACRAADEDLILFLLDKGAASVAFGRQAAQIMQVPFPTRSTTRNSTRFTLLFLAEIWPLSNSSFCAG